MATKKAGKKKTSKKKVGKKKLTTRGVAAARRRRARAADQADVGAGRHYCTLVQTEPRQLPPDVHAGRARAILRNEKKWVNGTVLHHYFFDRASDGETVYFSNGTTEWRTWTASEAEKNVVRKAFGIWESVGLGLQFREVGTREEAEIRIGFMRGDGSWSYIGRDVLQVGRDERTMNFGWSLTSSRLEIDTAVHEIGHTLGLPHEHQNPHAGIVWNEPAVYAALAAPPNNWSRDTTYHNIIRKIDPDDVQGSNWDPDSIMHYPFQAGLILEPGKYQTQPLDPAPGLSARDKTWVKSFYPPLTRRDYQDLRVLQPVRLRILAGQQLNFTIAPTVTREYEIRTFGYSDTVMVLFEDYDGELRFRSGDDDSGEAYNASIKLKLVAGRRYVLRVRLYYSHQTGETAVMMW